MRKNTKQDTNETDESNLNELNQRIRILKQQIKRETRPISSRGVKICISRLAHQMGAEVKNMEIVTGIKLHIEGSKAAKERLCEVASNHGYIPIGVN